MTMRIPSLVAILAVSAGLMLGQGTPQENKIYDDVRIKLANDRDVGKSAIDVEVRNGGDITLTGKVPKESDKAKAEKLARKVKGVKSVTNKLVVEHR